MSTRAAATPQAAARGKTPPNQTSGPKVAPSAPAAASAKTTTSPKPVAPAKTAAVAATPRRARLSARGALLLVVVMLLLVAAVSPVRNLLDERSRLAALQRQTQELQSRNDVLQQQVDQLNDPAHLEKLARQCLGMVKPGEIGFVMVPKRGAPVPPDC